MDTETDCVIIDCSKDHPFAMGDPVIVSSDDGKKLALVTGFIVAPLSTDSVSLTAEKALPWYAPSHCHCLSVIAMVTAPQRSSCASTPTIT